MDFKLIYIRIVNPRNNGKKGTLSTVHLLFVTYSVKQFVSCFFLSLSNMLANIRLGCTKQSLTNTHTHTHTHTHTQTHIHTQTHTHTNTHTHKTHIHTHTHPYTHSHTYAHKHTVVNAAFLYFETSKLWVLFCIFVDRWKAEGLR